MERSFIYEMFGNLPELQKESMRYTDFGGGKNMSKHNTTCQKNRQKRKKKKKQRRG